MREFRSHRTAPAGRALSGGPRTAPKPIPPERLAEAAERRRRERERPPEIGGPEGPEPTRYGDWERKGLCVDF